MAITAPCDMCQENDHDIAVTIRATGEVTWLCHACYPHAQAAYLLGIGWSIVGPPAEPPAETDPATEGAAAGEKPRRRPRVVKNETDAPPGTADPAGLGAPAAGADDRRGDDRLEAGGGDGGDPGAGAPGA